MLSKKYYRMIAKCINEAENFNTLVSKLCYEFHQDNRAFDRDRFRKACGYDEELEL